MGVGGVVNAADAEQGLDHGYDLIAVGRACIAYPDWAAYRRRAKSWSCLSTAPSAKRCTFRNRGVFAGGSDDPRHEHGRR